LDCFLRALFSLPIEDKKDRKLFKDCTGLKTPSRKKAKEAYIIAERRSGKSYISAIIAVYLATFKEWSKALSPGEGGLIYIVTNDKTQAKIIKNYISDFLNISESFKRLVLKDTTCAIFNHL
jgi:phage terminase large subunit-like protein